MSLSEMAAFESIKDTSFGYTLSVISRKLSYILLFSYS